MTKEEFINTCCTICGCQRCAGPDDEFAKGCLYYNVVFMKEKNNDPQRN